MGKVPIVISAIVLVLLGANVAFVQQNQTSFFVTSAGSGMGGHKVEAFVFDGEAAPEVSAAVIDAIQAGHRPAQMQPDEAVVYDFCTELRDRRRVSDGTFKAALDLLGEGGVVDLVATMGYYDLVSMALNVDRYPLPDGAHAPLPEPK